MHVFFPTHTLFFNTHFLEPGADFLYSKIQNSKMHLLQVYNLKLFVRNILNMSPAVNVTSLQHMLSK